MSIKTAADLIYTFRFIKTLTTKWEDTDAYELGIIDSDGKVLRKAATLKDQKEKDAYTTFHRLVFNIKRLLEKLPFGKTKLASYAAALFLIKEQSGLPQDYIEDMMSSIEGVDDEFTIIESDEGTISPGVYSLTETIMAPSTFEEVIQKGSKVMVEGYSEPVATFYGVKVYEAIHVSTNKKVYVTAGILR